MEKWAAAGAVRRGKVMVQVAMFDMVLQVVAVTDELEACSIADVGNWEIA